MTEAKKGKTKDIPKPKLPTKKLKLPAILTPENIQKSIRAVRYSGKYVTISEVLEVHNTTVVKWRKKFPEFAAAISHAMDEHKLLIQTNHPEFFFMAVDGIKKLLNDREIVEVTIIRERMVTVPEDTDMDLSEEEMAQLEKELAEDDDFPSSKVIKESTKTRRYIREPTWPAIEKVLGKKQLRNIIYESLGEKNSFKKVGLLNHLFSNWMKNDEIGGTKWNGSIFNDMVDLMILRALQAETKQKYESGELAFEEYHKFTVEQTKNYGYIAHNRESRAIKLLEGHSFSEIVDSFQKQNQDFINVVEAVCNDVSIHRNQIPNEIVKRISLIKQTKGLGVWASYQNIKSDK